MISRRNFDPETRTLRKRTADDDIEMEDTVEKNITGLVETIVAEDEAKRAQELVCSSSLVCCDSNRRAIALQDLLNIAPKRANWDLKRELDRKSAKLERKTQEAIHTLIRTLLSCSPGPLLRLAQTTYFDWRGRATTGRSDRRIRRHCWRDDGTGEGRGRR